MYASAYQAAYSGTGIFSVNYTRNDFRSIVQKNETVDSETHTYAYIVDGRTLKLVTAWPCVRLENVTTTMLEEAGNYLRLQRITQCKLKKSIMRLGRILNR